MQKPQGISFFNIKSGETHYARLEPTIQAYINSSDMGINASRDQDFGWRLGKEWVQAVRDFRRDDTKMALITTKNGGEKVSTTQILYAIYGEQMRNYRQAVDDDATPFEEQYLSDIKAKKPVADDALDNFDAIADQKDYTPAPKEVEPVTPSPTIGLDKPKATSKK